MDLRNWGRMYLKHLGVIWITALFLLGLQGCYTPLVGVSGGRNEGFDPVNPFSSPETSFTSYSLGLVSTENDFGFFLLPSLTNIQSEYLNYQDVSLNLGWGITLHESTGDVTFADIGISYGKADIEGKEFVAQPDLLTGVSDRFVFSDQSVPSWGISINFGTNWPSGFGFIWSYSVIFIDATGTLTESILNDVVVTENHRETLTLNSLSIGASYLF
jgi:hypothetical protein